MTVYLILRMIKSLNVNGTDVPIQQEKTGCVGLAPVVATEDEAIAWTGGRDVGYISVSIPDGSIGTIHDAEYKELPK